MVSKRVLVIDDFVPDPAIGAGAPRCFQLLRALAAAGAQTSMFPTSSLTGRVDEVRRLLPVVTFYPGGSADELIQFLRDRHRDFDIIIVSRPHNAVTFHAARISDPQVANEKFIIYDAEAIFAERELKLHELNMQPFSAEDGARKIAEEINLARGSHMVITVTEQNAAQFRAAGFPIVRVLGHAVKSDVLPSKPYHERHGLLFVGPTYTNDTPNSDSVIWFVDHVLPLIRGSLQQDIALSLAGTSRAPAIAERADGRIELLGMVPDLRDVYGRARVFIAPTRYAAGMPFKIHDAASHGVPCVVTPLLAEQLGWRHDRDILVAQTPEDFAYQCLRLYDDAALWMRIRKAAFARVQCECDLAGFDRKVSEVLRTAAAAGTGVASAQRLS